MAQLTEQQQIELLRKNDPNLQVQSAGNDLTPEEQAQVQLMMKNDPAIQQALNPTGKYGATINHLDQIPPTTPEARPPLSMLDTAKGFVQNFPQDTAGFFNAVRNAWQHPIDSAESLVNGVGKAPEVLRDAAGGAALNTLTPDVRQMVVGNNPSLQRMSNTGTSLANAPKAVGEYLDSELHSRPGEEWGTALKYSLRDHPARSLADASTLLTLPLGGAELVGGAARLAGRVAGAGLIGDAARAVEGASNAVGHAAALPARLGDTINPINFVPDIPGNALIGAGAMTHGLGAERIGNFLMGAGRVVKPTNMLNNVMNTYERVAMRPEHRVMLDAADGQAPEIARRLDNAATVTTPAGTGAELVPGSVPPAAESIADQMSVPRFQVLGQQALKNLPGDADQIRQAQLAAQTGHIQNEVSGTAADRAAAIVKRDTEKARDYGISDATVAKGDNDLIKILNRPELADVARQAQENYANSGKTLDLTYTPAHAVPTGLMDASGKPIMRNVPAVYPDLDGEAVDHLKKLMDTDAFERVAKKGTTDPSVKAIQDARQDFLNWVDQPGKNPMYRQSRENFAKNSRDIDQKNTGAYMESLVENPDALAAAQDNPANINTRNPTVLPATGETRYSHLSKYMEPGQINALKAVVSDQARTAEAARQAGMAGDYVNDLHRAMDPAYIPWFGMPGRIASMLHNTAIGHINPEVAENVSRAMLNPQGAAALMNNALAQQAQLTARGNMLRGVGSRIHNALIRNPTMYNIIDQQRNAMLDQLNQRLGNQQ